MTDNNNDQYLNDLYAYFQQQEQQQQNNDDIYSGCDYQNQYFDQERLVDEFSYNGGQQVFLYFCRQEQSGNLSQGNGRNYFMQSNERATSSNPISVVRNMNSETEKIFLKNQSLAYQSQHLSQRSQTTNNRSLNALVSASKRNQKKPKKTLSQRSTSTTSKQFQTKNKILQAQKEKKKNGDNSVEPLFLNPLMSLPTDTINIEAFQKFYKINYDNLLAKIEQIHKKLLLLGEKAFFKDKNNEFQLNDILQLIGMKGATKLGKGKALRELKALYKYMSISNPQNSQQKLINLGLNAHKFQPSYLQDFKKMLGYQQPQKQKFQSDKKGLERYGFQKLERKR